jgi:hypothetical protein
MAVVTDEVIRSLRNEGWKAERLGDDLVFTRSQVTEDTTSRLPMKSTRTFEVDLPTLVFPIGQKVRLAPDRTSQLALSAPDNFILATSPAESRQAGVGEEEITFSVKPDADHCASIDVEMLNPWFRRGVFKELAAVTVTGVAKWLLVGVAAGIGLFISTQVSSSLDAVMRKMRNLKRELDAEDRIP